MKIESILIPGKVSGIGKNPCPLCAGIAVRNQQESVSALRKNHCPDCPGITVRIGQEYALNISKNRNGPTCRMLIVHNEEMTYIDDYQKQDKYEDLEIRNFYEKESEF